MFRTLEFDKIREMLAEHAMSEKIKEKIINLEPYMDEAELIRHMNETTQARMIMESAGSPPLASMTSLQKVLNLIGIDAMLSPENLIHVSTFIATCRRMKSYLKKVEGSSSEIAYYGQSINDLYDVQSEIERCIRGDVVDDRASTELYSIRRKLIQMSDQIKAKIESILRANSKCLSENFVSYRNGHYTIPVKKQYKKQINGSVIDMSNSKGTYFIEPAAVTKLQQKLALLEIEEDNEVRKVLYTLTALVENHVSQIKINIEAMELLDFMFAKAKFSMAMDAIPAKITREKKIFIKGGRHPLIDRDVVVPLEFNIGDENDDGAKTHGIIITGPNTGGKTVSLKTVGLLSVMTQCGLHVPADEATFCMHNIVLCDIGDGQSITENLSTFSSHMTNIIDILDVADDKSLVLLDELGSGTDPTEGMGLATAILEEVAKKNCLVVATTHYPEIKELARCMPTFQNARMSFDRENLLPQYRLEIGEAGESCALYIAKRLGLSQDLINRAYSAAYENRLSENRDKDCDIDILRGKQFEKRESNHKKQYITRKKENRDDTVYNKFEIGDSVTVYPDKFIGLVYKKPNEKGEVGVIIKKKKHLINHKRIKLKNSASDLYPEGYDLSIVIDSVEDRRSKKIMSKRHDPNVIVELRKNKDDRL